MSTLSLVRIDDISNHALGIVATTQFRDRVFDCPAESNANLNQVSYLYDPEVAFVNGYFVIVSGKQRLEWPQL